MDENFNPYSEWLGLTDTPRKPDHYRLLGLEPFEEDPARIKQAADRATARVRSFRPGPKARDWARLLDELDAARKCLSDREQKSAYDAQLRDGGQGDPQAVGDAVKAGGDSSANGAGAGNPAMFPPGMAPLPELPRYGPAGPAPDEVASSPTALTPPGDAGLFAPQDGQAAAGSQKTSPTPTPTTRPVGRPGRVPMSRDEEEVVDAAIAAGDPMAPVDVAATSPTADAYPVGTIGIAMATPVQQADPMAPVATPISGGLSAATLASTHHQGTDVGTPAGEGKDSDELSVRTDPKRKGIPRNAIYAGAGALGALVIGGLAMLFLLPGPNRTEPGPEIADAGDAADSEPTTTIDSSDTDTSGGSANTGDDDMIGGTSGDDPPTPQPEPVPPITEPPPEVDPTETDPPANDPPQVDPPDPVPPADPGDTAPPQATPATNPEPPTDPEPAPLTPQEQRQLVTALAGARAALGTRDDAAVKRYLLTAERLARSDEDRRRVARLKELEHYVNEFWQAFDEAYANLKPTSTLMIDKYEVAIVEVRPDALILRVQGRNKTYPRADMPPTLVMAIADTWFNTSPANDVVRGAYWFVTPDGRPDEARRLWQQARAAGVDVDNLLPVLDDDY